MACKNVTSPSLGSELYVSGGRYDEIDASAVGMIRFRARARRAAAREGAMKSGRRVPHRAIARRAVTRARRHDARGRRASARARRRVGTKDRAVDAPRRDRRRRERGAGARREFLRRDLEDAHGVRAGVRASEAAGRAVSRRRLRAVLRAARGVRIRGPDGLVGGPDGDAAKRAARGRVAGPAGVAQGTGEGGERTGRGVRTARDVGRGERVRDSIIRAERIRFERVRRRESTGGVVAGERAGETGEREDGRIVICESAKRIERNGVLYV